MLPARRLSGDVRSRGVRPPRRTLSVLLPLALAACAAAAPPPAEAPGAELLLLGEQHDAAEQHAIEARTVGRLADEGRLAALALEMAEDGRSTAGLPRDAGEAEARAALAWNDAGWPWADYGPVVMAAVRRGVPAVGANLPRAAQAAAMRDATLDTAIDGDWHARLREDVREGHCGLLPESQLPGMTRVQIARDRAMATTLAELAARAGPGRVVLLVAGSNHVDATRGVPRHLAALAPSLRVRTVHLAAGAAAGEPTSGFDETWPTPAVQGRADPCEGLKRRLAPVS